MRELLKDIDDADKFPDSMQEPKALEELLGSNFDEVVAIEDSKQNTIGVISASGA